MTPTRDSHRVAYVALLACTVLVAVTTFVLSFAGLTDYGRRVAGLAGLSPLVPIGVDGLTLCAVAATFILRDARLRVRLYAWAAFAVAVALSVAGNLSHASARGLSWEGMIGAAAWPILLALASHMVIVVRRNMRPVVDTVSTPAGSEQMTSSSISTFVPVFQHAAPIGPEPAAPVDTLSTRKARRPSAADRVVAAHRRSPRASDAALAARLKVSEKTVQRYRPVDMVSTANGVPVPDLVRAGEDQ